MTASWWENAPFALSKSIDFQPEIQQNNTFLFSQLADVKKSMSEGMRIATKDKLKKATPTGRRDPAERCEARAYVYRKDVVLKITGRRAGPGPTGDTRGAIRGFTHQSRRRLNHLIRNTHDLWDGFLTLTYPAEFPKDGREVKRQLNVFCSWLRRRKVAYVWIMEFQERGAPHFHFLVKGRLPMDKWTDADGNDYPMSKWKDEKGGHCLNPTKAGAVQKVRGIQSVWTDIVNPVFPSERDKMLAASTRIEAVKNPDQVGGYMGAYMSKLAQKIVPKEYKNVGRFWGASRTIYRATLEMGKKKWIAEPLNPKTLHRVKGLYADAARALRSMRRWYARHCKNGGRGIGFKWKWRGQGFILCDGAPLFTSLLRQAVMIDAGVNVWQKWDGTKDKAAVFLTPLDRLNLKGQFLIDGNFDPTFDKWSE